MRLKELREYSNLTQKQLAEKIGNVQRNISNWESGVSEPDLSTVIKLAEFFNVTTDELLGADRSDVPLRISPRQNIIADIASVPKEYLSGKDARLIEQILSLSDEQKYYLSEFIRAMKEQDSE